MDIDDIFFDISNDPGTSIDHVSYFQAEAESVFLIDIIFRVDSIKQLHNH